MLLKIKSLKSFIGNTPIKRLNMARVEAYAKLEYYNYTGSIKDRPALYILEQAIISQEVNQDTTVVESSSGNFAIALATICRELGIKFIAVVDPNINEMNLEILRLLCHQVVMVKEPDYTQGYLLTRIKTVKSICNRIENSFWPNQYENKNNPMAYRLGLAQEIIRDFPVLDYLFVSVSSSGTICGLIAELKLHYKYLKIVAVDIEGSIIFQNQPQKRFVSGLGASKIPPLLNIEEVDDFHIVSHDDIIDGCGELLRQHLIFGGASSGAVYTAFNQRLNHNSLDDKKVLLICPDRGYSYLDTIYNNEWRAEIQKKLLKKDNSTSIV